MTRHATQGLLPADQIGGNAMVSSKHPQPVIDIPLLPPGAAEERKSAATAAAEEETDSEDEGLQMHRAKTNQVANGPARPDAPVRAKSEVGSNQASRRQSRDREGVKEEREGRGNSQTRMRHGFESQLREPEQATALSQNFFMYFEDKRHETAGNVDPEEDARNVLSDWRMKDRLKTVSAILAVCLNIGVDPPDVIKTNPCARLECWVDPAPQEGAANQQNSGNNNSLIGKNLQSQYENLSLRTRYKVILDPTIEELRRYTTASRRQAHAERILFHYNGHGVPKPTASGEVWCFNRSYTQYIPISLYDLQEWVGAPGLWVWDCSAAGGIIKGFLEGVDKHNSLQAEAQRRDPTRAPAQQQPQPQTKWEDCIHLAACRENEVLPTNPDLPADVFTSCLTTPIAMAIRFFILQNPIPSNPAITLATARQIPGKVSERRTPLGELNWIFTAITDTIAWNSLPPPLFKKFFRQDLMVAALFRNFLLAQRVMRQYHCHPQSWPEIPDTSRHPLWRSWDLAVEMILAQVPAMLEWQKAQERPAQQSQPQGFEILGQVNGMPPPQQALQQQQQPMPELEYVHSDFFSDQLSAFEVYLSSAPALASTSKNKPPPSPPEQLPIVLQVLLSQVHRLRALVLLSKFLDLGPWAVNLALSIGIFPYVLKLLQSQAVELKAPMIFIWARILAVDQSCQSDLLKDSGYQYFTNVLLGTTGIPQGNVAEHRAMCAFVLAMFCRDFRPGKQALIESCGSQLVEACLNCLLDMENPLLRQWSCLCLGNLWRDFDPAKRVGIMHQAHARIRDRSHDPVPEVRAACLDALTGFVCRGDVSVDRGMVVEEETLASVCLAMGMDGSVMVRKELTGFYSGFVGKYKGRMVVACWEQLIEEREKRVGGGGGSAGEAAAGDEDEKDGDATGLGVTTGSSGGSRLGHGRSVSFTTTATDGTESTLSSMGKSTTGKPLSKKTIYRAIWRQAMSMSADPHPEVARNAGIIVDYIVNALLASPLGEQANKLLDEIVREGLKRDHAALNGTPATSLRSGSRDTRPQTPPSPTASTTSKPDGYFALSRTASVAAAMKNFFGVKTPTDTTTAPPSSPGTTRSRHGSLVGPQQQMMMQQQQQQQQQGYKSRPLTPLDLANLPPDVENVLINGPPHQPKAPVPKTPFFVERDWSKPPEVPLKSQFHAWATSYFREPQMRPSETDEPGSLDYNLRLWRRNRNDRIISSTQPLKTAAGSTRWDVPCGYFGIGAAPAKMVFHQFEDHLVTSDDRDSIAVWDWREEKQIARFSNGNPAGSRVTELRFINEDDRALLMTGSSEGVIRIFRRYEEQKGVELAAAWRALSDLVVSDRGNAGLVFDWQQGQGRVLVAGDDRVVRIWQAGHELCVADIPARSGSCITALTSDQVEGNHFIAGFGNGSLRCYDLRCGPRDSMVMDWTDRSPASSHHRSWVVGVHMQRGGMRELVSAESNGGIRLWDLRARNPVLSHHPAPPHRAPRSLRTLAVHEHAPVLATGGADHCVRVYNTTDLKGLSTFEPYMSFLRMASAGTGAGRQAPITSTAFHPHRMMMAVGAVNDGHVNLFRCEAGREERERERVGEWGRGEWGGLDA